MKVLSKAMIEQWITPSLSEGKRGSAVRVEQWRIAGAILYRLKSGCQ